MKRKKTFLCLIQMEGEKKSISQKANGKRKSKSLFKIFRKIPFNFNKKRIKSRKLKKISIKIQGFFIKKLIK